MEAAWGKLTGYVDEQGQPHYQLAIRGRSEPLLFSPSNQDVDGSFHYEDIKGAHFIVYYVVYRSDFFSELGVRRASAYGKEQGGVRLYLDKFRVFAYGERGDDWLDLDKLRAARFTTTPAFLRNQASGLRRPMLLLPGNNQLFGAVYISQAAHPNLELTINRERLLDSEAFQQLKKFVQEGIFWLTVQYARSTAQDKEEQQRLPRETVASSLEQIERLLDTVENIDDNSRSTIREVIKSARQIDRQREEEVISELSMLRVLASSGTTIIIFSHQLRAIVDSLTAIHVDLTELRDRMTVDVQPEYDDLLNQLEQWRITVENQARQIGLLVGADARQNKRRLAIHDVVESVKRPLSNYTNRYHITVTNNIPEHLRTPPMFEAELHAILINILTNALKAVREQVMRDILFDAEQRSEGVYVRVHDTGRGIERVRWEEVFRPFVTTSNPDPILGVGTGLGLALVRDLLAPYGGKVRFIEPTRPWKTTIELFFPKEV